MENPFEIIARRLSTIEELLIDIKHRPANDTSLPSYKGNKVDFTGMMNEYYPGIPESTVRQDTSQLSRTKVGKRVLFDRVDIEEHLEKKHRKSAKALSQEADQQFANLHQRRGGRKSA